MGAALALAERGRGLTAPNPNVGCVIVQDGRVAGRGWTQPGGRPHAEAMALAEAAAKSRGATCYTILEPCAHESARGPACADLLVAAGVARVVIATGDPDSRTDGSGIARLRGAGIEVVTDVRAEEARRTMAGFLTRYFHGRPLVTLKLAMSLDGAVARADGSSRWITGPEARAHAHLERARHEAILVGRGTLEADAPALDVRLAGLEGRSPERWVLSHDHSFQPAKGGRAGNWKVLTSPADIADLDGVDHLFVEGGASTAAAFLSADLVDRLLLYRAPILIGGGRTLPDIGLANLAEAHGRWNLHDARRLGSDRVEVYERVREPA
ncbi:bifunctional diaminohydroxyphosphoribosylaminopyrimidine deaminase/5-amino-6-(5-phosphoribosylamino)uracil reductase RibD [Sphingomonas oligophenolica]|uniref:Riboflavin biosynthesis protein RibD n=1 Tax=Sphingomonas oligophenolica TaxID=301154 RepID=A0ABU9Y2P8_9SPHN